MSSVSLPNTDKPVSQKKKYLNQKIREDWGLYVSAILIGLFIVIFLFIPVIKVIFVAFKTKMETYR